MGGDQITCGVQDVVVACVLARAFRHNHGDDTAQRHGFVLDPHRSWTFSTSRFCGDVGSAH